jgi:hypothetical protein
MGNEDTHRERKDEAEVPILTLVYPGWQLTTPDPRSEIRAMLGAAEDALLDALHALILFEQTQTPGCEEVHEATLKAEEARYKELSAEMVGSGVDILDACHAIDAIFDRERWARGQAPKQRPWRLSLIYARSFMHSLNRVRLLLTALAQTPGMPKSRRTQAAEFERRFPGLAGVRDSSEHLHERIRGQARKGRKRLTLPTSTVLSENLAGNKLVSTMDDGKPGAVEISRTSVAVAAKCVQGVIDALAWRGPRQVSYLA